MIRKIEMERFSLTTSKRFDEVISSVNAGIGHPDMAEFGRSTDEAHSFAELKSAVQKGLSKLGLMLFMQLDQGAFVRKEARLWSNRSASERTKTSSWIVAKPQVIQTGSGRLVPGSRLVERDLRIAPGHG